MNTVMLYSQRMVTKTQQKEKLNSTPKKPQKVTVVEIIRSHGRFWRKSAERSCIKDKKAASETSPSRQNSTEVFTSRKFPNSSNYETAPCHIQEKSSSHFSSQACDQGWVSSLIPRINSIPIHKVLKYHNSGHLSVNIHIFISTVFFRP